MTNATATEGDLESSLLLGLADCLWHFCLHLHNSGLAIFHAGHFTLDTTGLDFLPTFFCPAFSCSAFSATPLSHAKLHLSQCSTVVLTLL